MKKLFYFILFLLFSNILYSQSFNSLTKTTDIKELDVLNSKKYVLCDCLLSSLHTGKNAHKNINKDGSLGVYFQNIKFYYIFNPLHDQTMDFIIKNKLKTINRKKIFLKCFELYESKKTNDYILYLIDDYGNNPDKY